MMRLAFAFGLTGIFTLTLAIQPAVPSACLRYEPDTVRVSGRLQRYMYYGAPGFGEDPRHDEQEWGFYLDLTAPVCAKGGRDPDLDEPHDHVRRIQLVLDSAGYARLRRYLGREVTLRGTLFPAHTGHHHAPILLLVLTPVRREGKH